ncbi:MAG TPA: hypothetical protein VGH28_34335 [Polyangiaceae bacterium]|jgi:hypothetical protein
MKIVCAAALLLAACSSNPAPAPDGGTDDADEAGAPTSLSVDCRASASDLRCVPLASSKTHSVGKGPNGDGYRYGGGFVDSAQGRIVLGFACPTCSDKDSGIMAIDLATGDRTLLSGTVNDAVSGIAHVGAGDDFTNVGDVQLAPGGKWWVLDTESFGAAIDEVDPATGDRTPLYTQSDLDGETGICTSMGLGLNVGEQGANAASGDGLANLVVHPDGKIYLRASQPYDLMFQEIDLQAIVELDQRACRVVSTFNGKDPYGWLADDGTALVTNVGHDTLDSIDIASGTVTTISSTGPTFGGACNAIAPGDETVLTTSGTDGPAWALVSIDRASGDRTSLVATAGPQTPDGTGAIVFVHPTLPGVYVMAGVGLITLFEPSTGNSAYLSR